MPGPKNQDAMRGFILEFNPPRLRDSVINEFDTLKTIRLEVPRKFIKESIPADVFLRSTTAKRIERFFLKSDNP